MALRRIAVVAFPRVQAIDVFGPTEVFTAASRLTGSGGYEVELLAADASPIETSSGIGIVPGRSLSASRKPLDTLIVAGGVGVSGAVADGRVAGWIARVAPRTRRVCSVCTGAFLLAEAGLLDGRRATTHWAACEELARRYPLVRVEPDPIFVRDGPIATSAGVTAGIDLALALVEEDHGPEIAREAARWLVLFLKRPGGQSQFSVPLERPIPERRALRELQEWMHDHLDGDLSVPVLAERALMSPRNFARVFRAEVGMTPAAYVERLRLERARALLEAGGEPIESIATSCGFGTVETLRRGFQREVGVSPSQYRERFADRRSLA